MSRLIGSVVTLAHGGGGRAMRDLVAEIFLPAFDNPTLGMLEDQARLDLGALAQPGARLAFTTDGFVVQPLEFPGGDIGKLAVCGTVNDLAVGGAVPLWLSCAVVIEEGFEFERLRRIVDTMRITASEAGVTIVTGDTKVVERGAADGLFITTAGVGVFPPGRDLAAIHARPGDVVLVNGPLGDHGAAVMAARGDLALETSLISDCRPLNGLMAALLAAAPGTRCARDATRGGVAAVLNEIAAAAKFGVAIDEAKIPVRPEVDGLCEILGLDPLYLANEGTLVAVVPPEQADAALAAMRARVEGAQACAIGEITAGPAGDVVMRTRLGSERLVDLMIGDQLPRIC
ncbi:MULTISPECIES: hydrogenase expression/formation protein HypE [Rhodopseudomonas]|uniref:Hydrogenase n=1 Tax=Rhodopseudomonas palustris TaxID=1076 RepID=A0A0D7ERH2_RHOPL|nr:MULTISPECIES: hydrogenase expression/formation protein HypE [Rhodopseudomonas]KIZ43160.1 hydrogenase [Rhodopseudomonas palustris]MDF3809522.1 hydrogenase expression/formation protein HypE [Rhodopseudomonas sp. BAL398]WOK19724.1 hydrogenase expression/formation protein HypE [Rhodopseudomonas sp. BAL398]